jgi:hypothetical protein
VTVGHRYLWATGAGLTIEPCSTDECSVDARGRTTCGGLACPACGRGGSNLSVTQLLPQPDDGCIHCGCGHAWAAA